VGAAPAWPMIALIRAGAKPADLPAQTPTKYELVVNLKTAKAFGLDLPASVHARADALLRCMSLEMALRAISHTHQNEVAFGRLRTSEWSAGLAGSVENDPFRKSSNLVCCDAQRGLIQHVVG